jgi:hypothetical protein
MIYILYFLSKRIRYSRHDRMSAVFLNISPCRLCREMTLSQSRDLTFRAKMLVHNHMEPEWPRYCRETSKWYPEWTVSILWGISSFHLNKRSFLEEGRCIRNDLWFISTIAQFGHVGLQQIGSKNMACIACHTHSISLIWAPVTSIHLAGFLFNHIAHSVKSSRRSPVYPRIRKLRYDFSISYRYMQMFNNQFASQDWDLVSKIAKRQDLVCVDVCSFAVDAIL